MVQQNDVIAIIIIILFIILALIAFGIYRLLYVAQRGGSSTGSGSDSRGSLVDD
jgi:thiol:disulfide interchange protein